MLNIRVPSEVLDDHLFYSHIILIDSWLLECIKRKKAFHISVKGFVIKAGGDLLSQV